MGRASDKSLWALMSLCAKPRFWKFQKMFWKFLAFKRHHGEVVRGQFSAVNSDFGSVIFIIEETAVIARAQV